MDKNIDFSDANNWFSLYMLWLDLYQALVDEIPSYLIPEHKNFYETIIANSLDALKTIGSDINAGDYQSVHKKLEVIERVTGVPISEFSQGLMRDKNETWIKPYIELNQAARILKARIDNPIKVNENN